MPRPGVSLTTLFMGFQQLLSRQTAKLGQKTLSVSMSWREWRRPRSAGLGK